MLYRHNGCDYALRVEGGNVAGSDDVLWIVPDARGNARLGGMILLL